MVLTLIEKGVAEVMVTVSGDLGRISIDCGLSQVEPVERFANIEIEL